VIRTDHYRGRARGRDERTIVVGHGMISVVADRVINVAADRRIINVVADKRINVVADSSRARRVGLGGLVFSLGMPNVVLELVPCGSGRNN
jgi:hypothetical protein